MNDNSPATLVIGIGNERNSDDAVGIAAARELQGEQMPSGVQIVEATSPDMNILLQLEGAQRVIVITAADMGAGPGTVRVLTLDQADEQLADDTQPGRRMRIADVLNIGALADIAPDVRIVAVQPQLRAPGYRLSEAVQGSLPQVLSHVRALLGAEEQHEPPE